MSDNKECFFISPIGDDKSDIRERSNKLMEYIIEEAISDYGYSVERADKMDEPGSITSQVIQKTVNSELVIADLTGHNPNVFYELAVRHATGKPCIQLINTTDSIPFDISDLRTIEYGLDVDEAEQARNEITSQLEVFNNDESDFDNPISRSAEMQSLRKSTDPTDQNLAEILESISRLDRKVSRLQSRQKLGREIQNETDINDREAQIEINDCNYILRTPVEKPVVKKIAKDEDMSEKAVMSILMHNNIPLDF